MDDHPIFKELSPIEIPLGNIYLDPNNPRFVSMKWKFISDEKITNKSLQDNIKTKLENEYSIDRLVMNMRVNGYLPIDRVIVRKFSEGKYVVLEGNRRICAAQIILQDHKNHPELFPSEIIESLKAIPCLEYTGDNPEASWTFQGLRHILGIQDWSAFNKAKLLVDLIEQEELTLTEVGQKFGLTPYGAAQWARGYYAFKQAQEASDYTSEIDERAYPFFQEMFSKSNAPLREWLNWYESQSKFENDLNFNEFLSWLYPKNVEEYEEDTDTSNVRGDWTNRLLVRRDDLRTLSYLIRNSKQEFETFRTDGDLEKAYSLALQKKYQEEAKKNVDVIEELYENIEACKRSLENIPFRIMKDDLERGKLITALEEIEKLIQSLKQSH